MPCPPEVACSCADMPDMSQMREWLLYPKDAAITLMAAVFFTIARIQVQKFTFQLAKDWKIKEAKKFSESCWKVLFYFPSWLAGVLLLYEGEFWPDTSLCWRNYPYISMSWYFQLYYLGELGFYFHSLYAHLFLEVKRSDYWQLLAHHVVTIGLIYFSYQAKFYRIGLAILVLHDTNDWIFEIGKTYVYREKQTTANVWFGLLLLSWIATRLGLFPFKVLYSTLFEAPGLVTCKPPPYWLPFNVALSFLLILHIYWFFLMLRLAYRLLIVGEDAADPREHED